MTQNASTGAGSASRTFADTGQVSTTKRLDIRSLDYVQWLKKSNLIGTYAEPKVCAVTPLEPVSPAAAAATDVNKMRLDYWPAVTGFYFPIDYIPHFTAMDGGSTDCPTVNDLESYDIAWIAAADLAPRLGRAHLVPAILMKVSDVTAKALERKLKTMLSGAPS